jgi:hypothetical protein
MEMLRMYQGSVEQGSFIPREAIKIPDVRETYLLVTR